MAEDLPPAPLLISSPYDPETRYSKKRETEWTGYKVHLTETCDDDLPHLLTDVLTTPATTSDFEVTPTIQANLAAHDLRPGEHTVDGGYVTAEHLVGSQTVQRLDHPFLVEFDKGRMAQLLPGLAIGTLAHQRQNQFCQKFV